MQSFRFSLFLCLLLSLYNIPVWASVKTVVNSDVKVLSFGVSGPANRNAVSSSTSPKTQVSEPSPGVLALSGNVPSVSVGDVLVSGQGQGLLRKVTKIRSRKNGTAIIETSQGKLTDVFKQADIRLKKKLGAGDFASITPLQPGISFAAPTKSGNLSAQALSLPGITCNFAHFRLHKTSGGADVGVEVNGTATISPSIDLALEIGGFIPQIKHARFVPTISSSISVKVSGDASASYSASYPIAHFVGEPILIEVGPVPVVFTPIMEVKALFSSSVAGQVSLTATASLDMEAGLDYQNGTTTPILSVSPSFAITPDIYLNAQAHITPLHPELQLLLYGVAGPKLEFELPRLDGDVTYNNGMLSVTGTATFAGHAYFHVGLLGFNKDYSAGDLSKSFTYHQEYGPGTLPTPVPNPTPIPTPTPAPIGSVVVTPSNLSLYAGDVSHLVATARDTNGTALDLPDNNFTWASANSAIATVDASTGKIVAIAKGTVTITVTEKQSGKKGVATVNVGYAPSVVTTSANTGLGSLREAINYANLFPGTTITFHIPQTDSGFQTGMFTMGYNLPTISQNVTIDGTTQTAFTGNTNATGPEITINNLYIDGGSLTFKGGIFTSIGSSKGDNTSTTTLTVAPDSTFTWSKGEMNGTTTLNTGGTINWTGGVLSGTLNIPSGGTLNYGGGYPTLINSEGVLNNAGTMIFLPGTKLVFASGSHLNNSGTCELKEGLYIGTNTTDGTFTNTGKINNVSGDYTNYINVPLINTSTINAVSGRVNLGGTGTTNNGTLNTAAGATILLSNLTLNTGTLISGAGEVWTTNPAPILAGTTTVTGTFVIQGLTSQPSAKLVGGGTVNWRSGELAGTLNLAAGATPTVPIFNWTGGVLSGTLNIPSGGTLNYGGGYPTLINSEGVLNNAGTMIFLPGTKLVFASGSHLNNSGTCELEEGLYIGTNTTDGTFTNTGKINNVSGDYTNYINVPLINTSTINAVSGRVNLGGTGTTNNGTLNTAAGATILLSNLTLNTGTLISGAGEVWTTNPAPILAGTTTVTGTFVIQGLTSQPSAKLVGGGTVNWRSGELAGTLNLAAGATPTVPIFNWTGGVLSGTLNIPSGGTLNYGGGYPTLINSEGVLNNAGTMIFLPGTKLVFASGSHLNNSGTCELKEGLYIGTNTTDGTFTNTGKINNVSGDYTNYINVPLINTSTINAVSGRVNLGGTGTTNNGTLNTAAGATILLSNLTLNTGTLISGAGEVWTTNPAPILAGTTTVTGTFVIQGLTSQPSAKLVGGGTVNWRSGELAGTLNLAAGATPTVPIFNWTGGVLSGTLNIPSGGTLNYGGGYPTLINSEGVLNNAGTMIFLPGTKLVFASGSHLNNSGTCELEEGLYIGTNTTDGTFTNTGKINNVSGDYTNYINVPLINTSTINAVSGRVNLGGTGTTNNGTLNTAAGATILLSNLTLNTGTLISGAGEVWTTNPAPILAGTTTVTGTFVIQGLTSQPSAKLVGGGTVNWRSGELAGTLNLAAGATPTVPIFNWTGGVLSGTLNIPSGGTLNYGGGYPTLINSEGVLNNAGTMIFLPGTKLVFASGSHLNNSGTCELKEGLYIGTNTTDGTFTNTGKINNVSGDYTNYINVPLINTSTINAVTGNLYLSDTFKQTSGSTNLLGGVVSGNLNFSGGTLAGTGTISGTITNSGAIIKPGGTMVGWLQISGDYIQASGGSLEVDLAGNTAGTQFDQLAVTGKATLAGTLRTNLLGNFTPATNASFRVLSYASRSGSFNKVVVPDIGSTQSFGAVYAADGADLIAQPISAKISNVTKTEGNTETTSFLFSVKLSKASTKTVTINFATANGTAIAGSDYLSTSGTVSFAAGQTSKTIEIKVVGDLIDENNETFSVNLTNPVNVVLDTSSATGTIKDDDGSPTLSIQDISIPEGNTSTQNGTFTVSLSKASGRIVTVLYQTTIGAKPMATAGSDFLAIPSTKLTFNPGEISKTIGVTVRGDTVDEPDEHFALHLNGAIGAPVSRGVGVATIIDDDAPPVISVGSTFVTEGDTTTTSLAFSIKLSTASASPVSVNYQTTVGLLLPATAGVDYTAVPVTTLTFAPGETSKIIKVAVLGDLLDEANETLQLVLSSPVNGTIGTGIGVGTIRDNDSAPGISINSISSNEGNKGTVSNATFMVSLNKASGLPVTIKYGIENETALAGSDYTIPPIAPLTFAPGETTKTIVVPIIGDDLNETNETFKVVLSSPTNATLSVGTGVGTIIDNDAIPTLSINDVSLNEGNSGTVNATFTVTLSSPSGQAVKVDFATVNDTAGAGSDYTLTKGTLIFDLGQTTKSIVVPISSDTLVEGNESFRVVLSSPVFATLGDNTGVGTIVNDDKSPNAILGDGSANNS